VRLYVCFNYSVCPGASDSHNRLLGLSGSFQLLSVPRLLCFFLCAHCVEGLASHADAVKIAVLGV
jgi:hypothetical protein